MILAMAAQEKGVDPYVVAAIAKVESSLNPKATGSVGEQGLFQLRPEFYQEGQPGSLYNPEENIRVALKLIKHKKKACVHKEKNAWVVCYNMGLAGARRINNPFNQTYYKKVMAAYETIKSSRKNTHQARR